MYRTTSEPSSGERSTGVQCSQPSGTDASDDIEASLHPVDQLSTEAEVEAPSSEDFPIGQQSEAFDETISLSSRLIPSVINDGVQELPVAVEVFIQTPTVSEIPSDQITTETAPVEESSIGEVIFSTQTTTTISKINYGRAQIKKKRRPFALENSLIDFIQRQGKMDEEEDWKKPIEDDFPIPEGSTEFCFGEHVVSVNVRDLYGAPLIDSGAFGSVYYARIPGPVLIDVAVKRVLRSSKEAQAEVKTLELVATGDNPNIVSYFCTLRHPGADEMCICMEYMDASLFSFYKSMHRLDFIPFGQLDYLLRRILRDCAQGLFHLQIKGVAHRDIKPQNLLINWDGIVKLCDFGISISLAELQSSDTPERGTQHYIPPERACNIQDDMWALGLSLEEIVNGRNAFVPDEHGKVCSKLGWVADVSAAISPEMHTRILHLLRAHPQDRPRSYEEILNWPCVSTVSEIPSMEEKDFVRYVIGQIPPPQHPK